MSHWLDMILLSIKRLGAGRILVGVVVGVLVGGPVIGVLAAEGLPGSDAVRPATSDEDELEDDELTPTPGGDDPDLLATATSVASPTDVPGIDSPETPTATLEPTATFGPTATETPDTPPGADVSPDQASPDQASPDEGSPAASPDQPSPGQDSPDS